MTPSERFLLEWLSKEDVSSYGECKGADLLELVRRGFAKIGADAFGRGEDYDAVSVTDAGWQVLAEPSA